MALLNGKVALVTGAGDGMGLAISRRFSAEGAHVVATDIDGEKLEAAHAGNQGIATMALDITDAKAPDTLIGLARDRYGALDILVNAAGIFQLEYLEELSDEQWAHVLDVNLNAPFRLCRSAIPLLKASAEGRIVNIASTSALRARKGMGAYTVSKHGLAGLTISLAVELGKYGITANYINPGTILTGITRHLIEDPVRKKDLECQGTMGRMGSVEEIAQAVLYLAGPHSGFTTGVGLAVDGGFLIKYPDRAT